MHWDNLISTILIISLIYVMSFGIRGYYLKLQGGEKKGKTLFQKGFKLFIIYIIVSVVFLIMYFNINKH